MSFTHLRERINDDRTVTWQVILHAAEEDADVPLQSVKWFVDGRLNPTSSSSELHVTLPGDKPHSVRAETPDHGALEYKNLLPAVHP